jgi:proliferating cell nuclear antigen
MLIKLDEPRLLSDVVSVISELVSEVRLRVDEKGLSIVAIDPANVALVNFKLPPNVLSKFEANQEVIGVNLDNFKSVLKRCRPGDSLVMKTEDNILVLEVHGKIKRTFNLALIDIEGEEKAPPQLEFSSRIEMSSVDFSGVIEDCSVVADSASFETKEEKFIIAAKGLNSARAEFSGDEAKIEAENAKSRYSLEYLQKFIKAGKLAEKVLVNFSDDYPLRLEFKNPRMELSFVLAPRVETED